MRGAVASDQGDWLAPVTGVASAGLTALLVWLGQRMIGKAAFQTALNNGFAILATELRKELDDERKLTKELRTEVRQLQQALESLERRSGYYPRKTIRLEQLEDIIPLGKEVGDAGGP